jgi:hypothetical protein
MILLLAFLMLSLTTSRNEVTDDYERVSGAESSNSHSTGVQQQQVNSVTRNWLRLWNTGTLELESTRVDRSDF